MKIEASDKEVQDILKLGYFKIPRFQRPYSWGRDEVVRFWDDVTKDSNENYFIGSMVVYQQKKPYFGIVDGQQRLTTITIVLAVIRDFFKMLDRVDLAEGVQNFIERANIDNQKEYVVDSETSFPFFQGVIQRFSHEKLFPAAGVEEKNLEEAYACIKHLVSSALPFDVEGTQIGLFSQNEAVDFLKNIRDKFLGLKLVFIQLESEEDAYLIFETLNARGRDLTTQDLIKNLLLKIIKPDNARLDIAKESWNAIAGKFPSNDGKDIFGSFIYHYWLSARAYITEKEIFPAVKSSILSISDANRLIEEFSNDSELYLKIISPGDCKWSAEERDLCGSLVALKLFNVRQHFSMLISLLRAREQGVISLRYLKKIVSLMEDFHFVFNAVTSQRSSGSIATHYSKYAIALKSVENESQANSVISEMLQGLKAKLPSYDEFLVSLKGFNYHSRATKDKAVIKYCLSKEMGRAASGIYVDYAAMTIEHVMPESSARLGVVGDVYGNIGNLILIDAATNSNELGDVGFLEKKKILLDKGYPLDEFIRSKNVWTEAEILGRCDFLARKIYPRL